MIVTRSTANRFVARGLALLALVGYCAVTPALGADKGKDIATLTRLSNDWDKAIWSKEEKAIADNMAEDFRIIDGRGEVAAKAAFVADIMDAKLTVDPYTVEEFNVRIYGDTALLSGRTHMTGKYDGQPFENTYRYIDIYVRKGGAWKIVSVQITKLPAEKPQ